MQAFAITPRRIALYAAAFAMTALVITVLAVGMTASSTHAQGTGGNTGDTVNNWPDPQPCGTGTGNKAMMDEPHEVQTGHFAVFDAYWYTTPPSPGPGSSAAGIGKLYLNECPPKMVTTRETDLDDTVTVTNTRAPDPSGIEIAEAIWHLNNDYLVDVVASDPGPGQLSLAEYPDVRRGLGLGKDDPVPAGTQVWWLRLDDPDTDADETSALTLGFSTALLDGNYWLKADDGNAMRYKLEVEKYPGDPNDLQNLPHFFTYKAPKSGNAKADLVWDGFSPGDEQFDLLMDPGEYEAVQWVFTRPGTYELLVELQGHVRDAENKPAGAGAGWKPISTNVTETTVAQYAFYVGTKLPETEPPIFGANRTVPENSPAGTKVGDPILVYNADAKVLYYDLAGEGEEKFDTVVAGTDPHAVQIVVADGASLDHEAKPSYEFRLTVTDKLNHEGDEDSPTVVIDDTLIVKLDVEDIETRVELSADSTSLKLNEQVNLTAVFHDLPANADKSTLQFTWKRFDVQSMAYDVEVATTAVGANYFDYNTVGTRRFYVLLNYSLANGNPGQQLRSNNVEVTWTN